MTNIKLIRYEQQAYDGAKAFYLCFLPGVMIITVALIMLFKDRQSYLNPLILIVSYLIALKYYKLCNETDTSLLRYSKNNLNTMT